MSFRATRTVEVDHDGERITITAGVTSVASDHPLVELHPELWEEVPEPVDPLTNGHAVARMRSGEPRPRMSVEQQLRIRRERLAELHAKASERRAPPDAETTFWQGVERLLADPQEERENAASEALIDRLEAMRARSFADEISEITDWLDR